MNKNRPLEKHAQFKKLCKYQVKFKTEAWITTTIQKPILVKHSFLQKYIKLKDYVKKTETHVTTEVLQKLTFACNSESKKIYITLDSFKITKKYLKRKKNLISWKQSDSSNIHILPQYNETGTKPKKSDNILMTNLVQ